MSDLIEFKKLRKLIKKAVKKTPQEIKNDLRLFKEKEKKKN